MIGGVIGAAFGLAILLAWSAWWDAPVAVHIQRPKPRGIIAGWLVATAICAGVVVWLVTGWPVLGVGVVAVVVGAPMVLNSGRSEKQFAEQTEAIASWMEAMRDTLNGTRPVTGALVATAPTAPLQIRGELTSMVRQLKRGVPAPEALIWLAGEIKNPVMDLVCTSIISSLEQSAGELPAMFDEGAMLARERAHAHARIYTARERSRSQTRLVMSIIGVTIVLVLFLSGEYFSPLETAGGQVILLGLMLCTLGCIYWMARLSHLALPERIIDPTKLRRESVGLT